MELSLYFTVFVLTMCAVHLVWTASAHINTWWNESVLLAKKPIVWAQSRDGLLAKTQAPQRSDWYAFFHCSDLVGREPLRKEHISVTQDPLTKPRATTSSTSDLRRPSRRPLARPTLS